MAKPAPPPAAEGEEDKRPPPPDPKKAPPKPIKCVRKVKMIMNIWLKVEKLKGP